MKNIFLLLFSSLVLSCNNSKVNAEVSDLEVESKPLHTDTVSTNIKTSQIIVPENVDDKFETFLKYFNEDSTFQISRIDFPLKVKVADSDKNYEMSEEIIQKSGFRKMDFTYDSSSANKEVDSYEQKINIKGNKAIIEVRGIENGIMANFYFEKKKGKWMLVTWEDSST
ncbi:DUF4348 domain-containing protein [Adhaeribacter pallidiroseus]|uniref:DUF4348 domain-containing protein n=1 Tax=Adhaeribacter pallidiroseus TaxID=2072847 RepID=A0A369QDU4_9BACT|nr:DUF4348 domain-containing protein [Adhaeribacter pallidiroseus]RDC62490.1 hypothetical protein AHMF7616_01084 [Adhaeribacter pallidiroseus]